MTQPRPQRLYAAALALGVLGLTIYANEHEELGMAGIVLGMIVGFIGFIGWRVKG